MTKVKSKCYYKPLDGTKTPKFAGIATFMKLPFVDPMHCEDVDVGIIGIPWDGGTTYKPGARHAPRQVREQSSFMRNVHPTLGIKPYELCKCADLGDANINAVNLMESLRWVEAFYQQVIRQNIVPLSVGGDHLVSLPIQSIKLKEHADLTDNNIFVLNSCVSSQQVNNQHLALGAYYAAKLINCILGYKTYDLSTDETFINWSTS